MGQAVTLNGNTTRTLNPDEVPAFVVPLYIQFTANQLAQLTAAGQQAGVPFQIGANAAQRAVGERIKAEVVKIGFNIRKNSLFFERMPRGKISIGFTYDANVSFQLNLYITAKDRSDSNKIKVAESRTVLGPHDLDCGFGLRWNSKSENATIDMSAFNIKPKTGVNSIDFDVIIICKPLNTRKEKLSNIIMYQAYMYRARNLTALVTSRPTGTGEKKYMHTRNMYSTKNTNKRRSICC
jgi:hypothetical protein